MYQEIRGNQNDAWPYILKEDQHRYSKTIEKLKRYNSHTDAKGLVEVRRSKN
jgi:hypothetical protein